MKTLVSQIIKRAFQVSDLVNTDFISHDEATHYVNEAWKELLQYLIIIGDTQFVKEVELVNGSGGVGSYTEYELPDDCYQIKTIRNKYSGEIITRHSDSEGINSNTYDVVNNRLRLYGVAQNPLEVVYYAVPTYLSYPEKDIDIDIDTSAWEIVSTAKDSVLLWNNTDSVYKVYNVKTGETIATFSITDPVVSTHTLLGNGHIVLANDNGERGYYDFKGNEIYRATSSGVTEVRLIHDEDYNVMWQAYDGSTWSPACIMDDVVVKTDKFVVAKYYDHTVYGTTVDNTPAIQVDDNEPIPLPFENIDYIDTVNKFNNNDSFMIISTDDGIMKHYRFVINDDGSVDMFDLNVSGLWYMYFTQSGIIVSNGTDLKLKSNIPDTEMNFPNSLFVEAIATEVAIKFCQKANASNEGLQELYQDYLLQFKASLDQNSSYYRIQNVY